MRNYRAFLREDNHMSRKGNPIRVLHIVTRMNTGGVAVLLANLIRNFDPKDIEARLVVGMCDSSEEDYLESRKVLFTNNDLSIGLAAPKSFSKDYFYRNSDSDEMLFVHVGSGKLKTLYGNIDFKYGDYLIIPRGIIYKLDFI